MSDKYFKNNLGKFFRQSERKKEKKSLSEKLLIVEYGGRIFKFKEVFSGTWMWHHSYLKGFVFDKDAKKWIPAEDHLAQEALEGGVCLDKIPEDIKEINN